MKLKPLNDFIRNKEVMLRYIYITSLFLIVLFVILYANWTTEDHLDNMADASCYSGRIIYDSGD